MKLYGLYKGVVIFDSDVADTANKDNAQGRVKVKIEGVSYTANKNESYKFPRGSNIDGGVLPENISNIDSFETWAYVCAPIIGESSMGRYNAARDRASVSDSSDMSIFGTDAVGTPPAAQFGLHSVSDAFVSAPNVLGTAGVNTYGREYFCDNRSNMAKGVFTVPSVGTHVLIEFLNGNRNYPVIIGALNAASDIEDILSVSPKVRPDYPLAFSVSKQPPPQV